MARRSVESEAVRLSGVPEVSLEDHAEWQGLRAAGGRKGLQGRAGADRKAFKEPSARTWPLCGLTSARLAQSLRLHSNPDFPSNETPCGVVSNGRTSSSCRGAGLPRHSASVPVVSLELLAETIHSASL